MGVKNYLIEGISGSGKTSVATELALRGYHTVHGDRELAYKGDPQTGEPIDMTTYGGPVDVTFGHRHHVWDVRKVKLLVADVSHPITFFCGGSRNFHQFIDLFDGVFVLDVDRATLERRLERRPADEFGGKPAERGLVMQLHATKEDIPCNATPIDATVPLSVVVDVILVHCGA